MPNGIEDVNCNLCGKNSYSVKFQRGQLDAEDPNKFAQITTDQFDSYGRVVKCKNCGLVYLNPRFSKEMIDEAYSQLEDGEYKDQQECRSINAHLSLRTIKKFKKSGKFLDVGAAAGYLLNASRLDFEPFGIEPSKWATSYIENYLKLKVYAGTFETVTISNNEFDVIAMVDVIEHFQNPKAMLIKAADILKKGGLLYIVTPDIDSLSAKMLGRYWWGLRPAHLYYFSTKTMKNILDELGFEIVSSKSYGRIFSMEYWASRISGYPTIFIKPIMMLISLFNISEKVVYINTRDSMEICAIKK